MKIIFISLAFSCALALLKPFAATASITIDTVPVGNVGNPNDPATGNLYGGVSYAYNIGTYEVTNAQYANFLNAKAASDPLALYSTGMTSDVRGGIVRSGVSGSYTYAPKPNMDNKPVNSVDWYSAIRFANWLNNGQGTGDTETGAYTLLGGTPIPSNGLGITRNVGATWVLPSENEWYKAAYYQPAAQGGDADNYWLYPTASNSAPTIATANSVGDISNPGTNVSNYNSGANWNNSFAGGNLTTVGSAGLLSRSFYGTYDQGGNLYEWNEARIGSSSRGLRGGSLFDSSNTLQSLFQDPSVPSDVNLDIGFRLATVSESTNFLLGDFNRDGHVNTADISVMLNVLTNINLYKTTLQYTDAQMLSIGDLNGDGKLNNADLQGLLNLLKAGGGSFVPVPEPSSLALASFAAIALLAVVLVHTKASTAYR